MNTTREAVEKWCVDYISKLMGIPAEKVDLTTDFDRFGIDSSLAVGMVIDLEGEVGRPLPPSLLFQFRTIAKVARHLSEQP